MTKSKDIIEKLVYTIKNRKKTVKIGQRRKHMDQWRNVRRTMHACHPNKEKPITMRVIEKTQQKIDYRAPCNTTRLTPRAFRD